MLKSYTLLFFNFSIFAHVYYIICIVYYIEGVFAIAGKIQLVASKTEILNALGTI